MGTLVGNLALEIRKKWLEIIRYTTLKDVIGLAARQKENQI